MRLLPKNSTAYGDYLASLGFKYPSFKKPGRRYVDVFGKRAYADPNKRVMLITYKPYKSESNFRRLNDAYAVITKNKPYHWQIVDSFTGKVFDSQRKW